MNFKVKLYFIDSEMNVLKRFKLKSRKDVQGRMDGLFVRWKRTYVLHKIIIKVFIYLNCKRFQREATIEEKSVIMDDRG